MESIWSKTTELPERGSLPGDITVDTAVIGGGMAGVLTAYQLRKRGIEAVVLEAKRVGSGQTKNTTAKITSQHGLIYHQLLRRFGEERAQEYARASEEAITEYGALTKALKIDCQFQPEPAYLYTTQRKEALREECSAARRLGIDAELCEIEGLPISHAQGLRFPSQAQFHPLRFLGAISQRIPVFENTPVRRVEGRKVRTDHGTVFARHIVFAAHFPFRNFPGFYFARMHQERSYVLSLEGAQELSGMYYGIDPGGLSFRSVENKVLLGGGAHRTGKSPELSAYGSLRREAESFWLGCRVVSAWSAQDCVTLDGVPYIGGFSLTRPDWYVATGFGKWGMTGSMVAARQISREIAEERKREKSIFSPRRFLPAAALPNLGKDLLESGKGLLKEILYLPGKEFDWLPPGQGAIIRHCGKKRGAYRDESGKIYLISVRCPHLGCQLEWNGDEKSWDCPCHGSRFDIHGNLIDNPAQTGLKHREEILEGKL